MHHAILLSLLFTLLPPSSSGLTLFFTNTSTTPPSNGYLELPSVYATIGTLPFTNITYHEITIIDHDTCHLGGDNNDHRNELMGKVMVFTGDLLFSMFSHCNNAHQANGVAVARLAQRAGAVAVVIRAFDQFEGGRAMGFTSSVTIPVLVLGHRDINIFRDVDVANLSLVFPLVSPKEKGQVEYLQRLWLTWRASTALIFGLLLVLCSYMLYLDVLKFIKRGYILSTNLAMKAVAVYSMLVSLLWTSVDPFGFQGVLWWKNSLLINLHFSSVVIVFTLILLMWIRAVAKMNFNQQSIIGVVFYVFCAVVWLISFLFGFLWDNVTTNDIFSRGITVIFVLLAVSYCVVGKDMIQTLYTAKSSTGHLRLILKIVLFISWYFAIATGVATVYSIGILGPIFELMLTILFEGLALLGTFLILFYQPFKQHKKSSSGSSNVSSVLHFFSHFYTKL